MRNAVHRGDYEITREHGLVPVCLRIHLNPGFDIGPSSFDIVRFPISKPEVDSLALVANLIVSPPHCGPVAASESNTPLSWYDNIR